MAAWRVHTFAVCLCLGLLAPARAFEPSSSAPGGIASSLLPASDGTDPARMLPQPLPRAFVKPAPENVRDLKDMQQHVQKVIARVLPLTVGLRVGTSQGSGIIITRDGYILTAAHVTGKADQVAEIILHDGRKVKGKTLGANQASDTGLIKITDPPGTWAHADLAQTSELRPGQWCLALGHPLGYQEGRPPVARLGRLLEVDRNYVRSDCPLVGGDSGGPLFDMNGQVIGIHSRIGKLLSENVHIPADVFRDQWEHLVRGEVTGSNLFTHGNHVDLGLRVDDSGRVTLVAPYSSAEKVGIKINDVVVLFDGLKVGGDKRKVGAELDYLLRDRQPGSEVTLQIRRDDTLLNFKLTLARRSK